jgi:hypothetical protein
MIDSKLERVSNPWGVGSGLGEGVRQEQDRVEGASVFCLQNSVLFEFLKIASTREF